MTKVILWVFCSFVLFAVFLWITSRPHRDALTGKASVQTADLPVKKAAKPQRVSSVGTTSMRNPSASTSTQAKSSAASAVDSDRDPLISPSADSQIPDNTQREVPMSEENPAPSPVKKVVQSPQTLADFAPGFGVDEILALPLAEQKKFLDKNQLQQPEAFSRFHNISESQFVMIDNYLKGRFEGSIDTKSGEQWILALQIDGQIEKNHFQGEISVEMLDKQRSPISRSHLQGPLDDHIRVVDEGERSSLLIQPTDAHNVRLYQIFIGDKNRQQLAGNYYDRNGDGKLQILGSFVLKKGDL